jgi:hypothetical protein
MWTRRQPDPSFLEIDSNVLQETYGCFSVNHRADLDNGYYSNLNLISVRSMHISVFRIEDLNLEKAGCRMC